MAVLISYFDFFVSLLEFKVLYVSPLFDKLNCFGLFLMFRFRTELVT